MDERRRQTGMGGGRGPGSSWLNRDPLGPGPCPTTVGSRADYVVSWIRQALVGLGACHDRRLLHRDIKPADVFLETQDVALLGDFGLAYQLDAEGTAPQEGSPLTMAPEMWSEGAGPSPRISTRWVSRPTVFLLASGPSRPTLLKRCGLLFQGDASSGYATVRHTSRADSLTGLRRPCLSGGRHPVPDLSPSHFGLVRSPQVSRATAHEGSQARGAASRSAGQARPPRCRRGGRGSG